jgi:hypothetical protein
MPFARETSYPVQTSTTHDAARKIHGMNEESAMPVFMDVHNHIPGPTKAAVTGAHQKDLEAHAKHGMNDQK